MTSLWPQIQSLLCLRLRRDSKNAVDFETRLRTLKSGLEPSPRLRQIRGLYDLTRKHCCAFAFICVDTNRTAGKCCQHFNLKVEMYKAKSSKRSEQLDAGTRWMCQKRNPDRTIVIFNDRAVYETRSRAIWVLLPSSALKSSLHFNPSNWLNSQTWSKWNLLFTELSLLL